MLTPEQNLEKLGIVLPTASQPIATYVNLVRAGNLLFMSGKGPLRPDDTYVTVNLERTWILNRVMRLRGWRRYVIWPC